MATDFFIAAAERDYRMLIAELDTFAARIMEERRRENNYEAFYLTDIRIDEENVLSDDTIKKGSLEYWQAMYSAAGYAAGMRADDEGIDINARMGKMIW